MLDLLPADTLHAEPETMVELLRQLRDSHGSIQAYLSGGGWTEARRTQLSERLIEPPAPS